MLLSWAVVAVAAAAVAVDVAVSLVSAVQLRWCCNGHCLIYSCSNDSNQHYNS